MSEFMSELWIFRDVMAVTMKILVA